MNTCPQNITIYGIASRCFKISISLPILKEIDELLFIESILSDLMDSIGVTFRATIISAFTPDHTVIDLMQVFITMPDQYWLKDFAEKVSEMQSHINMTAMSVETVSSIPKKEGSKTMYTLVAKDGIYVEKVKAKTICINKDIQPPNFIFGYKQQTTYPSYRTEYTSF